MKIEMRTVLSDFSLSEDTMKKIVSVLRYAAEQEGVPSVYTVTVGFTDDKVAEIIDGITEEDVIVVEGQNKLREGVKIKMEKAGN